MTTPEPTRNYYLRGIYVTKEEYKEYQTLNTAEQDYYILCLLERESSKNDFIEEVKKYFEEGEDIEFSHLATIEGLIKTL